MNPGRFTNQPVGRIARWVVDDGGEQGLENLTEPGSDGNAGPSKVVSIHGQAAKIDWVAEGHREHAAVKPAYG